MKAKKNLFEGLVTIAPYAGGRIVTRLHETDNLCALDLEIAAASHDLTVSQYVARFTHALEYWSNQANDYVIDEKTLVMPRERYLSETHQTVSAAAAELGRRGGKSKSEAKLRAIRANGQLGGRPRSRTYVAYSTENFQTNGITILALADTGSAADEQGRSMLPASGDMRADTWRKNFAVLSETELKRRIGQKRYDVALDRFLNEQREL